MRVRQLEYFVQVCEIGSITKAASLLNVAQPALGLQIKGLEKELGAPLLVRTPRGTTVTEAGAIAFDEAKAILASVQRLKRKLSDAKSRQTQPISLGLTPGMTALLTAKLLRACGSEAPHIKLQLFEDFSNILIDGVAHGRLDIALAYNVPAERFPNREPLMLESLFFICSPASAFDQPGPISFESLLKAEYVIPGENDIVHRQINEVLHRSNFSRKIAYRVHSLQAMKDVIAGGMACGILPYGTVVREVSAKTLVARPIVDPPIVRELFAIWPHEHTPTKNERKLLGVLQKLVRNLELMPLLKEIVP